MDWVKRQIVVEGPTARQAIFLRVRDEESRIAERFYIYGEIKPGRSDADGMIVTTEFSVRMTLSSTTRSGSTNRNGKPLPRSFKRPTSTWRLPAQ